MGAPLPVGHVPPLFRFNPSDSILTDLMAAGEYCACTVLLYMAANSTLYRAVTHPLAHPPICRMFLELKTQITVLQLETEHILQSSLSLRL